MTFPQALGPFGLAPCSCAAIGYGPGAAALRDPHGGPWSLSVTMLRAESFTVLAPQLQDLELHGHFAPIHKITLPPDARRAANIPDSAIWFTWSYPVSNRLHISQEQLETNADISFLVVGGYLYLDAFHRPVAANALVPNATGALRFAGPFRWPLTWTAQLHPSRFQPVTLGALRSAGALEFLWILPGEIFEGQAPCPHGGFAYRMQGGSDLFFALTGDVPPPQAVTALQQNFASEDELKLFAQRAEACRQAQAAAALEAAAAEEKLLSLQAERALCTKLSGFPHSLGSFGLTPCSCAALGLELGASSLRNSLGGPWKLNVGVLQGSALCVIGSQVQGQDLEGYFSPLHQVTLPAAARRAANIPDSAAWFSWSYPVVNRLNLSSSQLAGLPDASFLAVGGYVYLDNAFQPVAANAMVPKDGGALQFAGPYYWRPEWTAHMGTRFRPVSLNALRSAGATEFCWILPGEIVGGQPICPHGGFAYRMSGNAPDVFFAITGEAPKAVEQQDALTSQGAHETCAFLSEEQQRQLEASADAALRAMEKANVAGCAVMEDRVRRTQEKRLRFEEAQKQKMLSKFLTDSGFPSVNEPRAVKFKVSRGFQYPLHAAVQSNDAGAIKLLLWAGADKTKKDSDNLTPLECAEKLNCRNSHTRCIVALMSSSSP